MMETALTLQHRIESQDWNHVDEQLCGRGFALLENVLSADECTELKVLYSQDHLFRSTIDMGRYRFGEGEYRYFRYPLPEVIQQLRTGMYPFLVPTANKFVRVLKTSAGYPTGHGEFLSYCHQEGQKRPTPLILRYEEGGYNTLHQDLYGDVYFPFQAVLFLNQPNKDFGGGEFVMTEQRPRAQSSAEVLQPNQGDILIFTTNYRPVNGVRGYYRVAMRHGVSRVKWGERVAVGIIFHDAH
ncbi:2OG-Fe(II) oxygenase [Fulvivirga kasyanovii]|uniref:Prolyl 4-hydroxylase subunit alpha n=1 Tax=Fulvivirga kasyanovii TaxID=396812 RepID=A0ABW9RXV5_9BACT|nr:prolyl 4-hydroxylase subunit alpha [Fulvivirga kasyanovii]